MALTLTITNAGRAAIVALGGTNSVQIAQCGVSGSAVVPNAAMTALPGETKRIGTIAGQAVATDVVHLIVRDESADVFTVRSIGLYLADGTLFAIYGQPAPVLEKAASSIMLLAVDVTFTDIAANQFTFGATNFLDPPATTSNAGVVRLATNAEAEAGTDATRALTPANVASILSAAKILQRLLTVDGAGSGLDADLLDGQHGAYYADILARLGYTPLNQAAYTAGDVRTKLLTVDGSGSGLDADLLDGFDSAYFTAIAARLGFTPVNKAGDTISGALTLLAGLSIVGAHTRAGNTVWDAGNDGAGSGLDADLLDGLDSSYFTAIAARLGYVPVNKAGDTISGALTLLAGLSIAGAHTRAGNTVWDAGNDGAGSGLDADYLDGQDGNYYANVLARLGFTPVRQGGGPGQTGNTVAIGWNGNFRLKASVDGTDLGNVVFDAQVADVWHASNDGSGSGLDADLLDGLDSSAFERVTAFSNTPYDGYRVHSSGYKECWGSVYIPPKTETYVPLPVAHIGWVVPVGSSVRAMNLDEQNVGVSGTVGDPPTGFYVRNGNTQGVTFFWHTRGY